MRRNSGCTPKATKATTQTDTLFFSSCSTDFDTS
jgi:hypothetical protein